MSGIHNDPPLRMAARLLLSGLYVIVKRAASPLLHVARQYGYSASWPRHLDAAVNRACLPLTERPDDEIHLDVAPRLGIGDLVPEVPVIGPDGSLRSLSVCAKPPMLVVLARGSWCSYSRLHLADLDALSGAFEQAGVSLIAVTNQSDVSWWRAHGVRIPLASDPDGAVFRAMGVQVDSWVERAWGRVIPHESAFLFDSAGRLAAADVRQVSSTRPGQRFLSAKRWLAIVRETATGRRSSSSAPLRDLRTDHRG